MEKVPVEEQKIGLLTIDHVVPIWEKLSAALDGIPRFWEFFTVESVLEAIDRGAMQVWAIGTSDGVDLLIVSQIIAMPKVRVLRLMGASGEGLESYRERLEGVFDRYAVAQDCQRIEIVGRPGWIRKFRSVRGATYDYCVMSKPVEIERSH